MGRVHKNIATVMVELAQRSEATDAEVLQELERQTQELLGALDKLSTADDTGRKTVTIDAIQVEVGG